MPSPDSILVYGRNTSLLETRSWVLERAGYSVFTTDDLSSAEKIMRDHKPKLLLLCHSLDPSECQDILDLVNEHHTELKTLAINAGTPTCTGEEADDAISAFEGPRALLAAVKKTLSAPAIA